MGNGNSGIPEAEDPGPGIRRDNGYASDPEYFDTRSEIMDQSPGDPVAGVDTATGEDAIIP